MADRLRWWWIPAGLVVLIGTVGLPGRLPGELPAAVVHDAVLVTDRAVLQDATGRRTVPVALDALREGALVIALPAACRGQRGTMTLWRRGDAGREATPWLCCPAGPRDDGTVPIAGLAAGRYDVRFTVAIDGQQQTFEAASATAPGAVTLRAAETR